MLEEAHHGLHTLENDHFWYVGARAVYRALLNLGLGNSHSSLRMIEVGCGSGGNFDLLESYGPTVGVEVSSLALSLIARPPALGLVQASADALPFAARSFDGVALFGLIEHMPDDLLTLQEAWRVCSSRGCVALLTSAFPFLWSHHDDANLHQRRYYRRELVQKLKISGLHPIRVSFQNFFTFLPVWLIRWWQRRSPLPPAYDMGAPSRRVNALLTALLRLEAWLIRRVALPFGVDLVAVCRPLEKHE